MYLDTLTINNGTFLNSSQYAVQNWSVAMINGGTFESKAMSAAINGVFNKLALGTLTVAGGTFTPAEGYTDVTIDGSCEPESFKSITTLCDGVTSQFKKSD